MPPKGNKKAKEARFRCLHKSEAGGSRFWDLEICPFQTRWEGPPLYVAVGKCENAASVTFMMPLAQCLPTAVGPGLDFGLQCAR